MVKYIIPITIGVVGVTEEKTRFFAHDEVDHAREKISKNRKKLYTLAITVIAYFNNDLKISFANAEDGSSGLGFHGIIFIDGIDDDLIRLALSVSFLIVFARFIWFTAPLFLALSASKEHDRLDMLSSFDIQEQEISSQGGDPAILHENPKHEIYGHLKSYRDKENFTERVKRLFRNYHFMNDDFFPHVIPFILGGFASYFAVPYIAREFLWLLMK